MFDWLRRRKKPIQPVLYVMRLADMVVVHPQMDRMHNCSHCNEPVGIYPSGQSVLAQFANTIIVCQVCASPDQQAMLAPGVGGIESRQSIWNPQHPINTKRGAK